MKKNFKKIFILILSVIACFGIAASANAEVVLETLNAYEHRVNAPINYPLSTVNLIKATNGKAVYCMHFSKLSPIKSVKYTKGSVITDNGMNYILNQSYGKTSDTDMFIYKSALQLYMVDKGIMPGSYDFLITFKNMLKNDNSEIAVKIKNLISEAKKANANDTSVPTINVNTGTNAFALDSTGKYYVSNAIAVTSSTGSYTVNLTNAPEGSTVEKNGNTFVVKVPANKVANLETTISFKVSNTKDVYTSYRYEPNNSSYQTLAVTYKDTKTANANGELTLKKTVSVPFLKVDAETNEAISGAELKLADNTGKVIATWISSTTTKTIILGEGTYTLTETKAPAGYKAIETTVKFSIDKQGNILDANGEKIVKVVISNERKTGGVEISKQDITNKEELPGAKLQIKDAKGNTKEEWEWVSTDKPHYIEKLTPGTYTLTEITQPVGYILSEETITFEVKDDGSITKVVMYNTPIPSTVVPVEPTSSFKNMAYGIIGSLIIIAGGYIIFKSSKKKEVM